MVNTSTTALFLGIIFFLYLGAIFGRFQLWRRKKKGLKETIFPIIYFLAAVASIWLQITFQHPVVWELYEFFSAGQINFRLTLYLDELAVLFVLVMTCLRFLVFLFPREKNRHTDHILIDALLISGLFFFLAGDLILLLVGWSLISLVVLFLNRKNVEQLAIDNRIRNLFLLNRLSDFILMTGTVLFFIETESTVPVLPGNRPVEFSSLIPLFFGAAAVIRTGLFPFTNWFKTVFEPEISLNAFISSILPLPAGLYLIARYRFLFEQSLLAISLLLFFIVITLLYAVLESFFSEKLNQIIFYLSTAQISISLIFTLFGYYRAAIFYFILQTTGRLLALAGGTMLTNGKEKRGDFLGQGQISPFAGWLVFLGLSSVAGLPPLGGFWGNYALLASLAEQPGGFLLFPFIYLFFILFTFSAARAAFGIFMTKPETTSRVKEKKLYDSIAAFIFAFFVLFGGLAAYLPFFEQISILPAAGRAGHLTTYLLLFVVTFFTPALLYKRLRYRISPGKDFVLEILPFQIQEESLAQTASSGCKLFFKKSSNLVKFIEKNLLTPLWMLPNFIIKLSTALIRFFHTGKTVHYLNYTLLTLVVIFFLLYFLG